MIVFCFSGSFYVLQQKPYVFLIFLVIFRNGRFLLHSSRNILKSSTLLECEEALNNGSMTAAEVFVSMRSKSILHLFACIGRFLGLQVIKLFHFTFSLTFYFFIFKDGERNFIRIIKRLRVEGEQ